MTCHALGTKAANEWGIRVDTASASDPIREYQRPEPMLRESTSSFYQSVQSMKSTPTSPGTRPVRLKGSREEEGKTTEKTKKPDLAELA